jgi:hypothetical protein
MHSGRPTGVVVILVDASGERTMFPDNGANADTNKICVQAARFVKLKKQLPSNLLSQPKLLVLQLHPLLLRKNDAL